jgi:predicted aspartyl protease
MPYEEYEQIQDEFSNSSPITDIYVFNPSLDNMNGVKVKVIIDTGSGITSLPESVIENLGPLPYTKIKVKSPLDKDRTSSKKLYTVRLKLRDGTSHEIAVLGIPRDYGIIGRDVLHLYKIVLDSKKGQWGFECRWNHGTTCDGDNCIVPISS